MQCLRNPTRSASSSSSADPGAAARDPSMRRLPSDFPPPFRGLAHCRISRGRQHSVSSFGVWPCDDVFRLCGFLSWLLLPLHSRREAELPHPGHNLPSRYGSAPFHLKGRFMALPPQDRKSPACSGTRGLFSRRRFSDFSFCSVTVNKIPFSGCHRRSPGPFARSPCNRFSEVP